MNGGMIDTAFFVTWLAAAVRLSGPVLLASIGEIFAERSGVLNVGIEGSILLGALASYLACYVTRIVWVGFVAAIRYRPCCRAVPCLPVRDGAGQPGRRRNCVQRVRSRAC